jgi:hypothetical protein
MATMEPATSGEIAERSVSLADGGAGLGAMWGRETATRMLAEAGFGHVEVTSLPHDVINDYYTARK